MKLGRASPEPRSSFMPRLSWSHTEKETVHRSCVAEGGGMGSESATRQVASPGQHARLWLGASSPGRVRGQQPQGAPRGGARAVRGG